MIKWKSFNFWLKKKSRAGQHTIIPSLFSIVLLVNVLPRRTTWVSASGTGQIPGVDINHEIQKWQNTPVFDSMKISDEIERLERMRQENIKELEANDKERKEKEIEEQKLKKEQELAEQLRDERRAKAAESSRNMAIVFFVMSGIVLTLSAVFSIDKWLRQDDPSEDYLTEGVPMLEDASREQPDGEETAKSTIVNFLDPNTSTSISQTSGGLPIDGNDKSRTCHHSSETTVPDDFSPTSFLYPSQRYSLGLFPIPEGRSQESLASNLFDLEETEPAVSFETVPVVAVTATPQSAQSSPSLGWSMPKKIPGAPWN